MRNFVCAGVRAPNPCIKGSLHLGLVINSSRTFVKAYEILCSDPPSVKQGSSHFHEPGWCVHAPDFPGCRRCSDPALYPLLSAVVSWPTRQRQLSMAPASGSMWSSSFWWSQTWHPGPACFPSLPLCSSPLSPHKLAGKRLLSFPSRCSPPAWPPPRLWLSPCHLLLQAPLRCHLRREPFWPGCHPLFLWFPKPLYPLIEFSRFFLGSNGKWPLTKVEMS